MDPNNDINGVEMWVVEMHTPEEQLIEVPVTRMEVIGNFVELIGINFLKNYLLYKLFFLVYYVSSVNLLNLSLM